MHPTQTLEWGGVYELQRKRPHSRLCYPTQAPAGHEPYLHLAASSMLPLYLLNRIAFATFSGSEALRRPGAKMVQTAVMRLSAWASKHANTANSKSSGKPSSKLSLLSLLLFQLAGPVQEGLCFRLLPVGAPTVSELFTTLGLPGPQCETVSSEAVACHVPRARFRVISLC
jgi:hypothetical protein